MTSNLGGTDRAAVGFTPVEASYAAEVENFFRPELFNRIDDLVVFRRLSGDVLRAIAEKELRELVEREGIAKRNLRVEWTIALLDHLARAGSDIRYGARPLQRVLEQQIVAPLARFLVARPRLEGRVLIDVNADGDVVIGE
jgi:ATP-dependent Clp protease ATP-binding subunit ClpC